MDSIAPLAQRMPYTTAFPKALGTGLLISTPHPITAELRGEMERFIDEYEHALSRFRADSLVAHIGNAEHGGHFDFPDWAGPLFDLYDALHAATRGAIDPCVGEDLIRLGYDPALSFTVEADAGERLGALHGRAVWGRDVVRSSGTTLVTRSPVHVDFGACGKGYLVDSLGGLLTDSELSRTSHVKSAETTNPTCQSSTSDSKRESAAPEFVIDAGGDLLARTNKPIRVALEDPDDPSCAVGVALIGDGAFCASAPSRRHWEVAVNEQTHLAIHHLLNAIDGLPVQQTEATWVAVRIRVIWRLSDCGGGRVGYGAVRCGSERAEQRFRFRLRHVGRRPSRHHQRRFPRPFLLIADRSLIARLAGWRPANRRPQTGQSQAKLTE